MLKKTRLAVTATAETALKKLKKAQIPVYSCKKQGARFIFGVNDGDIKKVFAIFANPCYNIAVQRAGAKKSLLSRAAARAGLIVGAALFVAAAAVAGNLVLKVEVTGSGDYLSPQVLGIIREEGAKTGSFLSSFDAPKATGRILALPNVTFCKIKKRGSVLCVDVRVADENSKRLDYSPLVADVGGKVVKLVAICGVAEVEEGAEVSAGDTLISARTPSGEGFVPCVALGYAQIEWSGEKSYFAERESDESLKEAYASLNLEGEVVSRSHTVRTAENGVEYLLKFTCIHTVSINL